MNIERGSLNVLRCSSNIMKITAAEVIFKTLVSKCGKFECIARNKKHTDQCYTLPDSIRIALHDTRVTLRLAFHHNVTFFPAEFIRKGCRESDRYPKGPCLHEQGYVLTGLFTLHRQVRLWTSIFFPQVLLSTAHTFSAYLHFELSHAWIVSSTDESPKLC